MKKLHLILIFFLIFSTSKAYEKSFERNLFLGFVLTGLSFSVDNEVKDFFQKNHSKPLDNLSSFFTQFGSPAVLIIPISTYTYSHIKNDKKLKKLSKEAFISSVLAVSIVYPLKVLTNRERPDKSDKRSFPSGHTALSFAVFGTYAQAFNDYRKYIFYSVPVLVGFSRVYKEKHYLSDVIFGGLIGYLSVNLSKKVSKMLKKDLTFLHISYNNGVKMNISVKF